MIDADFIGEEFENERNPFAEMLESVNADLDKLRKDSFLLCQKLSLLVKNAKHKDRSFVRKSEQLVDSVSRFRKLAERGLSSTLVKGEEEVDRDLLTAEQVEGEREAESKKRKSVAKWRVGGEKKKSSNVWHVGGKGKTRPGVRRIKIGKRRKADAET